MCPHACMYNTRSGYRLLRMLFIPVLKNAGAKVDLEYSARHTAALVTFCLNAMYNQKPKTSTVSGNRTLPLKCGYANRTALRIDSSGNHASLLVTCRYGTASYVFVAPEIDCDTSCECAVDSKFSAG